MAEPPELPATPRVAVDLPQLAERYQAFLLDQFGVLHDGRSAFPGAAAGLAFLQARGRRVIVLSNSGKRASPNLERLARLGLGAPLVDGLVSSGEVAWEGLRNGGGSLFRGLGQRCLLLARGTNEEAVAGTGVTRTTTAATADFVMLTGIDSGVEAYARAEQALTSARAAGLPMLCTNPDLVMFDGPTPHPGPGTLARAYERDGGEVRWVGKPWPAIYECAMAKLDLPRAAVLAIGDSLSHDIAGAAGVGLDSALTLEGVHAPAFARATTSAEMLDALRDLGSPPAASPTWLLRRFAHPFA